MEQDESHCQILLDQSGLEEHLRHFGVCWFKRATFFSFLNVGHFLFDIFLFAPSKQGTPKFWVQNLPAGLVFSHNSPKIQKFDCS